MDDGKGPISDDAIPDEMDKALEEEEVRIVKGSDSGQCHQVDNLIGTLTPAERDLKNDFVNELTTPTMSLT
jgi:hypothetical protein